jgi:cytochrome c553
LTEGHEFSIVTSHAVSVKFLKYLILVTVLAPACGFSGSIVANDSESLDWLFPVIPATSAPSWDDSKSLSLNDSRVHYTQRQVNDAFNAPDWFPDTHTAMPDIVAHGRKPDVLACAFCHTATGQGRPENAALAGLSAAYISRQLEEMRSEHRKAVGPDAYLPISNMAKIAARLSDDEIKAAAEYFSKQSLGERVRLVEAERIPCVQRAYWIYVEKASTCKEDLGVRLFEVAPDVARHELRDETMPYVAYVPRGSIERGRHLSLDAAPTQACATCHGNTLRGTDIAPPIAGRSPTYLLRQMVAFQNKTREGERAILMQPVMSGMSMRDMIAAAAYAATLKP